MPSPLTGRRILVTRSRDQASVLAAALDREGAVVSIVPVIEIAPPTTFAAMDTALRAIDQFDWVVVTSANAVSALTSRARELGLPLPVRHLAAIGPSTLLALSGTGVVPREMPVLIPPVAVAESLLESLLPHIARRVADAGTATVLLLRAEVARDLLPAALAAAGASVTIAPAYRTLMPAGSAILLQKLFGVPSRRPEAITFTSSSTATNLVTLLRAASVTLPPEILRISLGPMTSATLRELGLPPHAEAAEASVASLIKAVGGAFSSDQP